MKAKEIEKNLIEMIANDWFLVGACKDDTYNMMTASWGQMGNLWNKEVMSIYVRPTRYTYEFIENSDTFSCSFFDNHRKELSLIGSKSGRDIDKTNIFNASIIENTPVFEEASLTIICKKIAQYDLDSSQFIDESIDKNYKNDYHRVYIGEIIKIIKK